MGKERLRRLLVNGKKCLFERAVIAKYTVMVFCDV